MVRHFETRTKAKAFLKLNPSLNMYKKQKGHKNRTKKPFVVCSEINWLNLY